MKKKYLFVALLLPFIFSGCDGNFGIKTLYCTYMAIQCASDSEVNLFCQSEKIGIPLLSECMEITDEETVDWVKKKGLINDTEKFKLFVIPSIPDIDDRNNISIYLKAEVNGEIFEGNFFIKELLEDSHGFLFKEPMILESEKGEKLSSVFAYCFWRSI